MLLTTVRYLYLGILLILPCKLSSCASTYYLLERWDLNMNYKCQWINAFILFTYLCFSCTQRKHQIANKNNTLQYQYQRLATIQSDTQTIQVTKFRFYRSMDLIIRETLSATGICNKDNRLSIYLLYTFQWNLIAGSSHPELFCRKGVLKNFEKFTRKQLCWNFFLIKLQTCSPATLLKSNSSTGAFERILRIFKSTYFVEHQRMAASPLHKLNVIQVRMLLL